MTTSMTTSKATMTPAAHGDVSSAARRTVRCAIATGLAVLPLSELFTSIRWVFDAWFAVAVVTAPAALLRLRRPARVWQTWVGVALLIPWLTARFVPAHAIVGVLPTASTWHDVTALVDQVRGVTHNGTAPVPVTNAEAFTLALIVGLIAAVLDLLAVVGRHPALAGVPILVVFTVASAVRRHPVAWIWFIATAAAYLILLSLDAGDTVREWGRVIPRAGQSRPGLGLGVSGPRIAVMAVAIGVLATFLSPARPTNLIANAFHHGSGSGGGGSGAGFGAGQGVSLDPFAALKGQLVQGHPTTLFTVTLDQKPSVSPFYLRANVLNDFTSRGWVAAAHGPVTPATSQPLPTDPPTTGVSVDQETFAATISILGLDDNPPTFTQLNQVAGSGVSEWSPQDQLLLGSNVSHGATYIEDVRQAEPTPIQLAAAAPVDPTQLARWLAVGVSLPAQVHDLVTRLTAGTHGEYETALALDNYFTNPVNGFTYSLNATGGDSGSALLDFLQNKAGFCQQYAAALAIMLRMAGVPSRVVLGYTHAAADSRNEFVVHTSDAHAWVEAFFPGIGWVPFDPTPLVGISGGVGADLAWAPHPRPTGTDPGDVPKPTAKRTAPAAAASSGVAAGPKATGSAGISVAWLWLGGVLVLAALAGASPAGARARRRRRRLHAGRRGDADALWAELSATARDLGYVWSPARTPRQVVGWLAPQVNEPTQQSLQSLAVSVEQARYAAARSTGVTTVVADLRAVESSLRARRSRSTRIRARLWPASLGWSWRRWSWRRWSWRRWSLLRRGGNRRR
jgi:transglutaminase-like putative cysteine protease